MQGIGLLQRMQHLGHPSIQGLQECVLCKHAKTGSMLVRRDVQPGHGQGVSRQQLHNDAQGAKCCALYMCSLTSLQLQIAWKAASIADSSGASDWINCHCGVWPGQARKHRQSSTCTAVCARDQSHFMTAPTVVQCGCRPHLLLSAYWRGFAQGMPAWHPQACGLVHGRL